MRAAFGGCGPPRVWTGFEMCEFEVLFFFLFFLFLFVFGLVAGNVELSCWFGPVVLCGRVLALVAVAVQWSAGRCPTAIGSEQCHATLQARWL